MNAKPEQHRQNIRLAAVELIQQGVKARHIRKHLPITGRQFRKAKRILSTQTK